ncbi:hypothetical protein PENTCL1PPCAC_13453 [Pristionchus entomophagus]|uniref:NR LBD domain-containing protein n=1 Tax=Pristionchus entomophagus TaxID=358040 RepID=A0AAV5T7S4_9BILA|nr:hypothetical protein PENTCL1PPCAC_13453 [Pristionchus entomophagus]
MPSYTTIFSPDRIFDYLIDCPPGVNKEEAAKEIVKNTTRNLLTNKAHFTRIQLTAEEFLALLGLALWNDHIANHDHKIMEIVRINRSKIMTELHKYYAITGRVNYAQRLGDVLCLLVNIEEAATLQKEDEKVYQLMDMFDDFTILGQDNWPRR